MFRKLLLASLAVALMAGSALADGKKYIVASDATWPPMELLDNQKNVIGYSTDYINAVAKEAGIDIEVRNVAWDGILTGVGSDRYQIIASSVTITPERRKRLDFSDPYCEIHQAVTLPKGQSIKSLQDLKGKKVGGQISTTGIFVLRNSKVDADIREYDDVGLALRDLASGRLDAVICDEPVARYYANKRKEFENKLQIALVTDDVEYYGFVVKKGNTALRETLNKGIKAVKEKGIEKQLMEKWMGK